MPQVPQSWLSVSVSWVKVLFLFDPATLHGLSHLLYHVCCSNHLIINWIGLHLTWLKVWWVEYRQTVKYPLYSTMVCEAKEPLPKWHFLMPWEWHQAAMANRCFFKLLHATPFSQNSHQLCLLVVAEQVGYNEFARAIFLNKYQSAAAWNEVDGRVYGP